jgi:NADPH-dependent curcumin reductase CurA
LTSRTPTTPRATSTASAAVGAVGNMVGQIAKIRGCRTVGIAGGSAKYEHVVNNLGFDACVDYKAVDWADTLHDATPDGIDVYFENAGGAVLETVVT